MSNEGEDPSTSKEHIDDLVSQLSRYEQLGQEVMLGKRGVVELDERRQKCREAVRQIRKKANDPDGDSWLCLGSTTFIKVPTQKAIEFLEEDMKTIDSTLEETREVLRKKVDEVRKMAGSKDLAELGFTLRPAY